MMNIKPSEKQPALLTMNPLLFMVILGIVQGATPLTVDLYLPAFPAVARDLHVGVGSIELTLAVFLVGMAVGQAVYGPFTDKHGRKKPLLVGLAVYTVGSLMCAVAPSLTVLMLGRLLQALGGSAGAVITMAMVQDLWQGKEAARRFSLLGLVSGLAPIIGPALGGVILTKFPWQVVFWGLSILGVVMAVLVVFLPETSNREERKTVRLRDALDNYLVLLKNRPYLLFMLSIGWVFGVLFAYVTASSSIYMETLHVGPGLYGMLFGLNAVGLMGASQLNRVLLNRFSLFQLGLFGVLLNVTVCVVLFILSVLGIHSLIAVATLFFFLMVSMGFTMPNLPALAMGHVKERIGSASALLGTSQFLVGGLAGTVVGLLDGPLVLAVLAGCSVVALTFLLLAGRGRMAGDPVGGPMPPSSGH
ncbi:multidrug effflux MFS transporter [Deinococcus roseus]|uniref:Bcr/CflA family drug resistance efflux transporter n=1 Tax=Deinococcus roseus TaxID=392414 RepID=A0ABQ2DGQ9_9DEIO|nr:multidrug effflux MFS transporter [Deinococcus roseus]GGJ57430.1 Bcr/CflA family drug resistance efflux transporter [Deinococcus roseus]